VNKGSDVVSTGSAYVTATAAVRRATISSRICASGLVSYEFLEHLESIADANGDGVLTPQEFGAARDASKVTVFPGCIVAGNFFNVFTSVTPPGSCSSPSGSTAQGTRSLFSGHRHKN
jgi:hypothetical protein